MDRAIEWYGSVLGLALEKRWDAEGVEFAHLAHGGIRLELFVVPQPAPSPDEGKDVFGALSTLGAKHIGFSVDDIKACERDLRARGVEVILGPQDVPPVNVRNLFVRDQDGNQFEFVERM